MNSEIEKAVEAFRAAADRSLETSKVLYAAKSAMEEAEVSHLQAMKEYGREKAKLVYVIETGRSYGEASHEPTLSLVESSRA